MPHAIMSPWTFGFWIIVLVARVPSGTCIRSGSKSSPVEPFQNRTLTEGSYESSIS